MPCGLSADDIMAESVINTGYSHLVLVESADANSASKLFLALTNINEFNSKFIFSYNILMTTLCLASLHGAVDRLSFFAILAIFFVHFDPWTICDNSLQ